MKTLLRFFLRSRMNHWFDRMNLYGQNAMDACTLGAFLYWRGLQDQARFNLQSVKIKWRALQ
jgi:hypothetical protein